MNVIQNLTMYALYGGSGETPKEHYYHGVEKVKKMLLDAIVYDLSHEEAMLGVNEGVWETECPKVFFPRARKYIDPRELKKEVLKHLAERKKKNGME